MKRLAVRYAMVALLFSGSATLLFSCVDPEVKDNTSKDALMTEYSEDLSIVMSRNGRRSYFFTTPLVEGYALAQDPYKEFRKGVKITTYQDDSLSAVDAVLTANYAIFYEKRELWEAKGNVVVEKSDGKRLYTQQLFWSQRTKKIYSNVDTKIVQGGANNTFIGEGFESDEEFKDWRFRRMKGRMEINVSPSEADSTTLEKSTTDSVAVTSAPVRGKGSATPTSDPAGGTVHSTVTPRPEQGASVRRSGSRSADERRSSLPQTASRMPVEAQRTTMPESASRMPVVDMESIEQESESVKLDLEKK